MAKELAKVYEPKKVEAEISKRWLAAGAFDADPADPRPRYCIVIPPPNVTDALHLGHALNNTLQDVLIRWRRMGQFNTLWMPGTDHAGIATQTVVEKRILAEEGKRRTDFAREEFVARVQAWKDEYEARILEQLKTMGCSCDWRRTRFTMDEVCAGRRAGGVLQALRRRADLPRQAAGQLGPRHPDRPGRRRGGARGGPGPLLVPAVSPGRAGRGGGQAHRARDRRHHAAGDDARRHGRRDEPARPAGQVPASARRSACPSSGGVIPIIADEHVVLPDPNSEDEKARFSTGFLKVTPAHDPDD